MDKKIKKGDNFVCIREVVMDGDPNAIAYKKGEYYSSERDGHITNTWGQTDHEWKNEEGEDNWWDFFKKLSKSCINSCDCRKCKQFEETKDWAAKPDKDYFQSVQEEYGKSAEQFDDSVKIMETFSNLSNLLVYKNNLYGNSGLTPINVFSKVGAETGLLQRLDDKIARVKNSPEVRKNDVADIIGYLVLICVSKGWTSFDEFKD